MICTISTRFFRFAMSKHVSFCCKNNFFVIIQTSHPKSVNFWSRCCLLTLHHIACNRFQKNFRSFKFRQVTLYLIYLLLYILQVKFHTDALSLCIKWCTLIELHRGAHLIINFTIVRKLQSYNMFKNSELIFMSNNYILLPINAGPRIKGVVLWAPVVTVMKVFIKLAPV